MKRISLLTAILFIGSWFSAISLSAMDRKVEKNVKPGVVKAWRLGDTNYCHLKFPPITRSSLFSDKPQLVNTDISSVALIDYYGPCDYNPVGEVEVERQRRLYDSSYNEQ